MPMCPIAIFACVMFFSIFCTIVFSLTGGCAGDCTGCTLFFQDLKYSFNSSLISCSPTSPTTAMIVLFGLYRVAWKSMTSWRTSFGR